MTIYVDELPKSCEECEYFTPNHCSKYGRNFCLLARMPFYNTKEEREKTRGQHKDSLSDFDCPLQSLADYTKQVRKEEKIKINRLVRNWLIKEGFTAYKFDELFEEIRGTENE